jgi:hypothetical protein
VVLAAAAVTFVVKALLVNMGSVMDTALLFQARRMPPRVLQVGTHNHQIQTEELRGRWSRLNAFSFLGSKLYRNLSVSSERIAKYHARAFRPRTFHISILRLSAIGNLGDEVWLARLDLQVTCRHQGRGRRVRIGW